MVFSREGVNAKKRDGLRRYGTSHYGGRYEVKPPGRVSYWASMGKPSFSEGAPRSMNCSQPLPGPDTVHLIPYGTVPRPESKSQLVYHRTLNLTGWKDDAEARVRSRATQEKGEGGCSPPIPDVEYGTWNIRYDATDRPPPQYQGDVRTTSCAMH
jgi:hypothetical protein